MDNLGVGNPHINGPYLLTFHGEWLAVDIPIVEWLIIVDIPIFNGKHALISPESMPNMC